MWAGVVLDLLGGLGSLACFVGRALRPESFPYPHEVPRPATRAG